MMCAEECKSTQVELQENGIIRNSEGVAIGRLEEECVTEMKPKRVGQNKYVQKLVEALEYYSTQEHFEGEWENPSGEPENLLCLEGCEDIGHWVESGQVAKQALKPFQEGGADD